MSTEVFDAQAADALAERIARALVAGDLPSWSACVHPGQDAQSKAKDEEWVKSIIDAGYNVTSWGVSSWKQPDLEIFNYISFHPEPVAIIEMQIRNPQGETSSFFVASAPLDGSYLKC